MDQNKTFEQAENKESPVTLTYIGTSGEKPAAQYAMYADGEPVGTAQLRHTPSRSEGMPEGFESHISYEINPAYQKRGFAAEALKQLIAKAAEAGLRSVIITVPEGNMVSRRVIENNNGTLLERKPDAHNKPFLKYRITM